MQADSSRSRSLSPLALALALLAGLAAFCAIGVLPQALLPWCAAPALLASAALPLLARFSPVEPAGFKLALCTLTLSPPLAALVWGAWHLTLDARGATAAAATTIALLHLLGLRRRVRGDGLTRAHALVIGAGLALALAVAAALLRGSEPRLQDPALARAAVALAIERSLPPLHPWLAGEAWTQAWSADLLAAFCARVLQLAPTQVHAGFAVFAALILPAWLFLLAESIWADSRRSLLSVLLALSSGLWCLAQLDAPISAVGSYLLAGPSALALSLSIAGLACAGHALRHGERPWVGLCGLFHGLALLLEFSSAWPAALAVALAALAPSAAARARPRVLLALLVCALPALAQARLLSPAASAVELELGRWAFAAPLPWIALACAAAGLAWSGLELRRRAVLLLCLVCALTALCVIGFAPPLANQRSAVSLALFAAGIAAAGVAAPSPSGARALRSLARLAALALAFTGLLRLCLELLPAWTAATREHALVGERGGSLEAVGPEASSRDLSAALACLRSEPRLQADRAVLLACPAQNPYRKTRDLPQAALPACSAIALYGEAPAPQTQGHAQFQPRLEELLLLFRHPAEFDPTLVARLAARGAQTVVALVREEDRALNPALVGKLERLGFRRWRSFGDAALYVGPLAAANRYVDTP